MTAWSRIAAIDVDHHSTGSQDIVYRLLGQAKRFRRFPQHPWARWQLRDLEPISPYLPRPGEAVFGK